MAPFVYRCPMRWSDLDVQNHINNAKYVDYLQEARVEFLSSGANRGLLGHGVIVTRNQVEFLRPLEHRSGREVEVRLWISELGGSRFVVRYELSDEEGNLAARAATTLCVFDMDSGRLRRLTDEEREVFRADLVETEPWDTLPRPRFNGREHRSPIRVRWSDLDAYGHVNNYRYFDYAQEARVRMTSEQAHTWRGDGPPPVWFAARQDVDYLQQVHFRPEPYEMATALTGIGNSSLHLAHELRDEQGTVFASLRTVLVHADPSGRPTRVPDALREALSERLLPAG